MPRSTLPDLPAANKEWAKIDHAATDGAPWVTMFTPKQLDFVSKNVKNFTFSDQFKMILSLAYVQ
jgi:peptide/nickel transport system substrate-binding protein